MWVQVRAQAKELSSKTLSRVRAMEQKEVEKIRGRVEQECLVEREERIAEVQARLEEAQSSFGAAHRAAQLEVCLMCQMTSF